jgi:hypothetical protein
MADMDSELYAAREKGMDCAADCDVMRQREPPTPRWREEALFEKR